ncbi:ThiF family adenylyltransferase [Arenibacter algicola]|uniref:UBA/THIF-type NAD/FAD binding protein n=1 Tax=Arenibacter algicola TaxID=616991 RepID=A0A221V049_9FLAO|nr:ThiF family adenylyltransferase [Arenibacter algicola]ASO06890.1 UBA/THIF-type NAD/FAD binding protein [Arenibacter algicola]
MSQQLINHSPDLKRLRDEGYEIEVRGGYLLIHHIPFVDQNRQIKYGVLVSTLTLSSNNRTAAPDNHVIHFIGDNPCGVDGTIITAIQHSNADAVLNHQITVNRSFSNKPAAGYPNYYEKVKRYVDIISAPAKYLDLSVTEKTFKVIADIGNETVFQYIDTNSSRANIEVINARLERQKIAIIGLGGTGAYILDMVAKTPVKEIHLYDGDSFDQHNAFRSPGAASMNDLNENPRKADYYQRLYSNMHKYIHVHDYYVKKENLQELDQMDYVFVCVDKNAARKIITDYLVSVGVAFSDVGLGVNVVDDKLIGAVRVTSATRDKNDHLPLRIFSEDSDNNEYATNIQIAELNALNAIFAILKWKKISGIYVDLENEHHSSYSIGVSKIFNEDVTA